MSYNKCGLMYCLNWFRSVAVGREMLVTLWDVRDSGDNRQCCSISEEPQMLVTLWGVRDSGDNRQCCSISEEPQAVYTVRACSGDA